MRNFPQLWWRIDRFSPMAWAFAAIGAASTETATENLAAYADVAKTAQLEGVELVISAGRDVQESAAATLRKATDEAAKTAAKRG